MISNHKKLVDETNNQNGIGNLHSTNRDVLGLRKVFFLFDNFYQKVLRIKQTKFPALKDIINHCSAPDNLILSALFSEVTLIA